MNRVSKAFIVFLMLLLPFSNFITVNAYDDHGYDLDAPHEVNVGLGDQNVIKENQQKIFSAFVKLGYSKETTAGIMGNLASESGCIPSRVQGNLPWGGSSQFWSNSIGYGLIQWTDYGRKGLLLQRSVDKGVQWTDLDMQIEEIDAEFQGYFGNSPFSFSKYGFNTIDEFKAGGNGSSEEKIAKVCECMMVLFERPYDTSPTAINKRVETAKTLYNELKDINVDSDSDSNSETVEVEGILSEWELVGMPGKPSYIENQENIGFATLDDFSTTEKQGLYETRDLIYSMNQFTLTDYIRIAILFLGLCMITYAILLGVGLMFDKSNIFFDFSMVGLLTLKRWKYAEEGENSISSDGSRLVTSKKVLKSVFILLVVGFVIVSGSIFNIVQNLLFYFGNMFS